MDREPELPRAPEVPSALLDSGAAARRKGQWTGFGVALAALTVLGLAVSFVAGFVFVMASDGCGADRSRYICTPGGQQTVFWLPWGGLLAGFVLSLVGAAVATRLRRTPWLGLAAGVPAYLLAFGVAYSIAVG
ncbi:hypothetical protein [Qaidamihabitans albus]|uniref:hypothetical protein n=1 Tax=Qaidamihabitans albus TaxID=2795733 RepID=UPI0018F20A20|nr:hypothetical protein [Qaidamihabitans albus]